MNSWHNDGPSKQANIAALSKRAPEAILSYCPTAQGQLPPRQLQARPRAPTSAEAFTRSSEAGWHSILHQSNIL